MDNDQKTLQEEERDDIPETEEAGEGLEETEELVESPERDQKDREYFYKTMSSLKRELMKKQSAIEQLQGQLKASEQKASTMTQTALESFKGNALTLMEKAKTSLKHAHEMSDVEAMIQANTDLATATAQLQWANTVPVQRGPEEESPSSPASREESVDQDMMDPSLTRWIQRNPWIDERSPHYHPDKAGLVIAYATSLETQLTSQGRGHEINSPAYFKQLDTYSRYIEGQQGERKEMKDVRKVSPRGPGLSRTKEREEGNKLTAEEKELCDLWGMDEAQYLKNRMLDRQKSTSLQGEGRYGR
jgi:hypothetical protein